ncbi:MAG: DUF2764 family protein [Candidatus Omnitrophica bacterium]|nr:DUF2764 family protein [Candidatus Omnitrophota bacterium]
MDKYYYFVAQLPLLIFGQECYASKQHFLEQAKKWLSDKDFVIISGVSLNDFYLREDDNKVLSQYKNFEKSLKKEIESFRKNENRGENYLLNSKLNLEEGTPLEIEKALLRLRWKFIEFLEEGHFFDLEILIVYFLKIQILEKLFTFDRDKGTVIFDKLCEVAR